MGGGLLGNLDLCGSPSLGQEPERLSKEQGRGGRSIRQRTSRQDIG